VTNTRELVSLHEIADRLGRPVATVSQWRWRHRHLPKPPWRPFPDPIKTVGRSPVFDWAEVEQWAKVTGRIR
jgi:predicted DNA-binding transcriptional regulator AlpA